MRLLKRATAPALFLSAVFIQSLPARQGPPIKVTTRLVEVSVVVHEHGRPVANLTKEDFEVKDAGKLETISLFSMDQTAAPAAGAPTAETLPKNFSTNRPLRRVGESGSVSVVLIDTYNTKLADQAVVNRQLMKFLKQIRPEDHIAIYELNSNGFGIIHDFSNNADVLEAALSKAKLHFSHQLNGSTIDLSNTGDDALDATLDVQNMIIANFYTRNRVLNTCASIKALADHLSGIPGRKNLIWLTGSVPIAIGFGDPEDIRRAKQQAGGGANEQEQFASLLEATSKALNTANVAVYPVDARGLFGLPFVDASKDIKLDSRTHQLPPSMTTVDNRNAQTMDYVAELTGGRAFHDTNDLAGAVRAAIDDAAVTYTLGYYVQESEWDNRYHKIKVSVRRSGMKLRTKKGYLAQEQPTQSDAQLNELLRKAVWSPLDSTRLAITARIDPSPKLPNASRIAFALLPSELEFRQENGKYRSDLNVLLVQERKRGERVTDLQRTLKLTLTPERYQDITKNGFTLSEDLKMEPDTVAVRVIALDRYSGSLGSVTMVVETVNKSGAVVTPER